MTRLDLTATARGTALLDAGFWRAGAHRYLRVTEGDVAQRIEVRPNRRGGELTCDLTIHPLWAREDVPLEVLEPGTWIRTLCERSSQAAPVWYVDSDSGVQQMVEAIIAVGLPWFDATATAEGIVRSAEEFSDPWRNTQFVHVELGHSYLRAGHFEQAQEVFDRKPKRVPRYRTLTSWIAAAETSQIDRLHAEWIASSRAALELLRSNEH